MKKVKPYKFLRPAGCIFQDKSKIGWIGKEYRAYPQGKIISALFGEDPENWFDGRLKPGLKESMGRLKEVRSLESYFLGLQEYGSRDIVGIKKNLTANDSRIDESYWKFCADLGCNKCRCYFSKKGYLHNCRADCYANGECKGEGDCSSCQHQYLSSYSSNPLLELYMMGSFYPLWVLQSPRVRRTMLILDLIGEKRGRPNGYRPIDITRIGGSVRRAGGQEIIDKLVDLGFLLKMKEGPRNPRYYYNRYNMSKKTAHLPVDEHYRLEARNMLEFHKKRIGKGKAFHEGIDYVVLGKDKRIFLGRLPPCWVIEILKEFDKLLVQIQGELIRPLALAGDLISEIRKSENYNTEEEYRNVPMNAMSSASIMRQLAEKTGKSEESILRTEENVTMVASGYHRDLDFCGTMGDPKLTLPDDLRGILESRAKESIARMLEICKSVTPEQARKARNPGLSFEKERNEDYLLLPINRSYLKVQ